MLEAFFLTVNEWIASGTTVAALGCFVWGMISVVFSPCHLASIPLIVAYVGGQQQILKPKEAGYYSAAFTFGLFITIALIGIICALLGRMLGDVGNYWQILVGLVLLWVALGMFGVEKCSMSGTLALPSESQRPFWSLCSGPRIWGSFGFLYLRFYRSYPRDYHHTTESGNRSSFYPSFCHRALHSYSGGRQFHCCGETAP